MLGSKNLIRVPETKHCQAGVGQLWDQVRGERRGDEGTGEELSGPPVRELLLCADKSLKIKIAVD